MIIPKIWSLVGGIPTPLKNDGVKVSWEYEIPKWKVIKFQTTNQCLLVYKPL